MRSMIRNSITRTLSSTAAGATVPSEEAIRHSGIWNGGGGYYHGGYAYHPYQHGYYGYGGPGWAYGSHYWGPWPLSMIVNPWACP
jgi:hypothetical protein